MKIALFLVLMSFTALAQQAEKEVSIGTRSSYFSQDTKKFGNTLNFVQMKYKDEVFFENATLKRNFEFRAFDPVSTNEKSFVDPVNVSLELMFDKTSFQIGFLRYRFSETFGVQIMDVANPRDYSEFILNDLAWAKRSVFGMNMQNKWDRLEALWMLTAWSNGDRLPYQGTPFDLSNNQLGYTGGVVTRPWFHDYEYGARFNYLFENGLDVSVLGYHHYTRPPMLALGGNILTGYQLKPKDRMVTSTGISGSYAMDEWVFRGDFLMTFQDNILDESLNYIPKDHYQQIIGVDRTWNDLMVGVQIQNDLTYYRNFGGTKLEYGKFEFWKPSVQYFLSQKGHDEWFQIKNSFEYKLFKVNVTADFMDGEATTTSLFGPFRNKDRYLVEFIASY